MRSAAGTEAGYLQALAVHDQGQLLVIQCDFSLRHLASVLISSELSGQDSRAGSALYSFVLAVFVPRRRIAIRGTSWSAGMESPCAGKQ